MKTGGNIQEKLYRFIGPIAGCIAAILVFFITEQVSMGISVGAAIGIPLAIATQEDRRGKDPSLSRKQRKILFLLLGTGILFFVAFMILILSI